MKDFLDAYHERNWVTIPVGYRQKAPLYDGWSEVTIDHAKATRDRDFPDGKPTNVGVALGAPSDGLVDIDLDCPEANELADIFLPATLTFGRSSTPRSHRLYRCLGAEAKRYQDPVTVKGKDGKALKRTMVEIRSTGGQTVFPPSVHISGEPISFYGEWVEPLEIEPAQLVVAVEKLAAVCLLARYWPSGGRHDAQLALAGALLSDGWDEEATVEILCGVCRLAGDEDRPKREATVRGTAEKVRAGEPVTGWKFLSTVIEKKVFSKIKQWLAIRIDDRDFATYSPATDLANARRMVKYFGQDLRYVKAWRKWLAWDGKRWDDGELIVQRFAKATIGKIYEEAAQAEVSGNQDYAKFLRKHAAASSSASALASIVRVAQSEPEIEVSHTALDRDTTLFNCTNGTVDLRTKELLPHRREDLITKLCPYPYDPTADCPIFRRSLYEMMKDDEEMLDYVQLVLGYALTGSVKREIFVILHGSGENGKSQLMKLYQQVIGDDYQTTLDINVLLSKEGTNNDHPTGRAVLFGKRLAVAYEPDMGKKINEGQIKALTGGDIITARRMREDFWQFHPTHTAFLVTNHKPGVRGTDHGLWRRILLIPFDVIFSGEKRNDALPGLWMQEAVGFLAWLIEGAWAFLNDPKLIAMVPERARVATKKYREEEDRLAEFFEACTEKDPAEKTEFSLLYGTYRAWCDEEHELPMSRKAFARALEERGFEDVKGSKGIRYRAGIKLTGPLAAVARMRR